jgi:hypothetical protein
MKLCITIDRKTKEITETLLTDEPADIDYQRLGTGLADGYIEWMKTQETQSA